MRHTIFRAVLVNVAVGVTVFVTAVELGVPSLVPCFDTTFQDLMLACATLLAIDLALLPKIGPVNISVASAVLGFLCAVAAWFGAYRISPLGFGKGRFPVVVGFRITRSERQPIFAGSGRVVVIAAGSILEIEPIALPGTHVACYWRSRNGGAIDEPANCDIAYQPPIGPAYDVLSLVAQPDCGLPSHVTEIRFSITP